MEGELNETGAGEGQPVETPAGDVPPDGPTRTGTVPGEAIAARKADEQVFLVVRVPGDGPQGEDVEYVGAVREELLVRLNSAGQRAALLDAVRAERDRRRALEAVRIEGLVGAVLL
jgi:hypothetical protein